MNGVMADSVSAGSSHFGASVTWAAKFIWPSGAACTWPTADSRSAGRRESASTRDRGLIMPSIVPIPAAASTAPGVIGQHLGHARGHLHARGQIDELVRAVGVGAWAHHAGDQELRPREALTEHAHERDRAA